MLICCEKNRAWESLSPCFSENINIKKTVFSEKQKEIYFFLKKQKEQEGGENSDGKCKKTISCGTE